ncbi:MAG: ABC transporter ATP-binding protein [Lachnospiraceae bacterium]|nr:ABC transporter ATP-binding protein [Lachnospiraceae bacterium]
MIKTLAGHIKGYRAASVLTPLFMLGEVIMEMIVRLLMASIIDEGIQKGDMQAVFRVGGMMFVCSVLGLSFGVLSGHFAAYASSGFAKNIRFAMFEKIQDYSFANIDHFSTAGLVTRLTTDVTNLQNAYQMILRMCIRAPFSLIIAMCMAFWINARISMIYFAAVIFLGICISFIMLHAMRYFREVFQKYDDLNASVQENVTGIRVIKAYVREDYEISRFSKAAENIYKLFVRAENMVVLNMPLMQFTVYACILGISYLGARMIVQNTLTTGELMSLLTYCMNILMSLMMLSVIFVMLSMSAASAERISEVLSEEPTLKNPENPDFDIPDGSVCFEDVSFRYHAESEEPVLSHINLDIRSGETIGIIGGTGSSKSTLVSMISRLYDVDEGRVLVGGKDVRRYDLETLRNNVSVVLQKNVLFSGTVLENLRWGDEQASLEECKRACRLACADEFIEKLPEGYDSRVEQGAANFSGGQRQRLCIARALLKKPKILILDDSTSAVDTATDAKIRKAFAQELPETTKFIISQRVSSVMDADKILILKNGVVDGFGSHGELMETNDIYRQIYQLQTGGNRDFDE